MDVFNHVLPPRYLKERGERAVARFSSLNYAKYPEGNPALSNMDVRFRIMDRFEGLVQVLTIAGPNIESITEPGDAVELATIANDEMAELVYRYPDRFVAAIACLPMSDVDAALKEADRAINDLKFRGVEIFTDINGKPIDSPEFLPLYEKMEKYDLPVFLHPRRENLKADYPGEKESKYLIFTNFGWPYETSISMSRLVFGGVLQKYPDLKVITHHAGAMVPFFCNRINLAHDYHEMRLGRKGEPYLTRPRLDYFRRFYCDTAIQGNTAALMCAYAFFGAGHMLFGTDAPHDNQLGERFTRETIRSVEEMTISDAEKKMIFEDNARRVLRLPL
ncbi:MAG: amidohydrolase family protein [Dehalococcoidia bacterium]|nr:amidohydrolase family protein [Dehalococcoidia bacterium]